MKIVSLLPAATEIVCALGLEDSLVGVTHECDYPASVRDLPKVTSSLISATVSSGEIDRLVRERANARQALYTLDVATLERLLPDLIVTQALCDVCAVPEEEVQAAACALPGAPRVVNLAPMTLWEVFESVRLVAQAANVAQRGEEVVAALRRRVDAVAQGSSSLRERPRVAFLEWLDPPFSSGHWTPELVRLAGGRDVLSREGERSRTLSWSEVTASQPDVVVVACCGFDVQRACSDLELPHVLPHVQTLAAARSGRLYVIDGSQYFSRPGPRLVDGLEILAHALHPEAQHLPNGLPAPASVTLVADATHTHAVQLQLS